jgi:endo-1,3-1,4-beta-glycanase ExoK
MTKLALYCIGAVLFINFSAAAKEYNGAELFSKNTVKYGRFDVRMRTISGSGVISSFFLYYDNSYLGSPEPWQEIDIETLGKTNNVFQTNIITGNAASKATSEKLHTFDNLSQNYHTFTVEWTPNYIAWFFDGTEVRRTTDAQVTACREKEMTYRFNAWISDATSWAGAFNSSILPVYQLINWIKYSKYTPGSGPGGSDFSPDWQDNFDTFDATRWAKGDWTFDGNLVDFSPNNIVVKDGYCIICLTKTGATGFSGEVPKDQGTGIGDALPNDGLKMRSIKNPSREKSTPISLTGRSMPPLPAKFKRFNSGMWIEKENNAVTRRFKFCK